LKRIILQGFLGLFLATNIVGCIESSFELASESRLPKWFQVPEGLVRGDLKVTLDYYTDGSAVFKLYRKDNMFALDKVKGKVRGNKPIRLKNLPLDFPKNYPMYQVITISGITEAIEHRKLQPIFFITDDSKILKELEEKKE